MRHQSIADGEKRTLHVINVNVAEQMECIGPLVLERDALSRHLRRQIPHHLGQEEASRRKLFSRPTVGKEPRCILCRTGKTEEK